MVTAVPVMIPTVWKLSSPLPSPLSSFLPFSLPHTLSILIWSHVLFLSVCLQLILFFFWAYSHIWPHNTFSSWLLCSFDHHVVLNHFLTLCISKMFQVLPFLTSGWSGPLPKSVGYYVQRLKLWWVLIATGWIMSSSSQGVHTHSSLPCFFISLAHSQ